MKHPISHPHGSRALTSSTTAIFWQAAHPGLKLFWNCFTSSSDFQRKVLPCKRSPGSLALLLQKTGLDTVPDSRLPITMGSEQSSDLKAWRVTKHHVVGCLPARTSCSLHIIHITTIANRELSRAFCRKPSSRVVWCHGAPITLLLMQDCCTSIKVPYVLRSFQYNTLLPEVSKQKRKCYSWVLKRSCLVEELRAWCLEKWYCFAGASIKSSLDFS